MKALALAQKIVKNAPNPDWKKEVSIVKEIKFELHHEGRKFPGRVIYVAFADPKKEDSPCMSYVFAGFQIVEVKDAYILSRQPVLHYKDAHDSWDKTVTRYVDDVDSLQRDLKYRACKCGTFKPKKLIHQKRVAREVIGLTYQCPECGEKEYDVFD